MATLHRFKLLATQCATAAVRSPVSSPSASPCPHIAVGVSTTPSKSPSLNIRRHRMHRRRSTLRRLLSGSSSSSGSSTRSRVKGRTSLDLAAATAGDGGGNNDNRGLLSHTSLKDLFVSSPSSENARGRRDAEQQQQEGAGDWHQIRSSPVRRDAGGGWRLGLVEGLSSRRFAGSVGSLRYRLLRRAWRPVLVTIPE